ncbi:hypothetical protein RIF29_16711 [Crotalaria pallida]|uniref:RNase H type-1 domain-containing protein n=1 Tax=Crotalaria pallida TaxID=3830 RepID=A0AAN9FFN9_CROPI
MVRIDMDGSYLGEEKRAGFGGVIRDNNGSWIVGFSSFLGDCAILLVELLGMRHGLALVWEKVIHDIRKFLSLGWIALVQHNLREANSVTNFLAKLGVRSSTSLTSNSPQDCSSLLLLMQ